MAAGHGATIVTAVTEPLAAWCAKVTAADVPEAVRAKVALLVLDGLGCGLFGSTLPWGRIAADFAASTGTGAEATVWGTDRVVPVTAAPLANGTFVHGFEFDDLHPKGVLHGAGQVVPAALAVAELRARGPADGARPDWLPAGPATSEELLAAITAGFEVGARIGVVTGATQLSRGFHPSPNTGTMSAAVAAGCLLGFDADRMRDAIGVAGSFGGSLMAAQYGAMVKRVHAGRASQAGVTAALLAARGLTGIPDVVESPYGGFVHAYTGLPPGSADSVAAGLGEHWETLAFTFKAYPCCGSNHTSIDAYLSVLEEEPTLTPDRVEAIDVACSTLTYDHVGWPYEPTSVTAAQMNLRYCVAAVATDQVMTVDQFAADRIADPDLLRLASRVHVTPDPAIDALGREHRHLVRVEVRTTDGRSFRREVAEAKGRGDRPLRPDDVTAKYRDLAGRVLAPDAVTALEDNVSALGTEEADVAALTAALSVPHGA